MPKMTGRRERLYELLIKEKGITWLKDSDLLILLDGVTNKALEEAVQYLDTSCGYCGECNHPMSKCPTTQNSKP